MAGGAAVRLFTRSTSVRIAAARIFSSGGRLSATKPLSHRMFRCPVELSVCLETVQPFHTVTASALTSSVVNISRRSYGWLPEGFEKQMFNRQNEKQATEREAYLWSVADM